MKIKPTILSILALAALGLAGCDVGNAPAGMSADEAKANFEKQSPEEQIKMINGSPASAAEKASKIAEIRKKNNLPDPGPGAAPASAPPGTPGGAPSFPGDPRAK